MQQLERGIVAVACRVGDLVVSMPAPARHGELLWAMGSAGLPVTCDQGFLDHRGLFLGRRTAKIVAAQCGQISRAALEAGSPDLFSEDIW